MTRAYVRNDSSAILDHRYNLAVCLMELQEYSEALRLVKQAKDDLLANDQEILPDLHLLEATIFFRSGRPEESWRITEKALSDQIELSPAVHAQTHYLRGLISSRRNDLSALRESISEMGQPESDSLKAALAELRGRLAMAEKKWDDAVLFLDEAALSRMISLDYRRMAVCLALAAEASEHAGHTASAASRYLQAGRSAMLRGERSNGRVWLIQAAELFERLGNDTLAVESRSLLSELQDDMVQ